MHPKLAKFGSYVWELVKVVAISLAIVLPIRYFLVQPFYVKGASMEPNFHDYEYLIIDELSYRWRLPERTEVVVMRDPLEHSKFFIKRIIGLPGDTVLFDQGDVYVNGILLDEAAYLAGTVETLTVNGMNEVTLQDNEYFVMGDNRPASFDSRRFGAVDKSEFVGRVWVRAWPFTKFATY
ncbi:MAG: signal peptidase I [uncultured bacterium]|nr:MAG: signal peptidase I [uncultured bacterium]HBY73791.1 signal peptidase I [Candidatus Kerfeldbacteria bacterium]